ncbi:MAG TPA: HYR domain-containing protein [Candidatus Saccharimonadales bacterium]|nr:HYR domain-containing protein [Candidatus Saccharimonadales bacterium]
MKNNRSSMNQPSVAVWGLALTAFLASSAAAPAQSYSIRDISVPNAAAVSVLALNATGQVAGYFDTSGGARRAFRWTDGLSLDLGTLGGTSSSGTAMNNLGQVVGMAHLVNNAAEHAFLAFDHTLFDLGTIGTGLNSTATAVSDAGFVTGNSEFLAGSVEVHAFVSRSAGVMLDLGTLGGDNSFGYAANNAGQVTGDSSTANGDTHAFLYSGILPVQDLGTLGGTGSSASALNQSGQVTGDSTTLNDAETHAFLYSGGVMQDLHTLGGAYSFGYVINDAGQVAGDSELQNHDNHAFLYSNGTMLDLGTLPGGDFSTPWMLNNLGQVVGNAHDNTGGQRAFLWQDGTMHDLNALLPANSGWSLTAAYFINDSGQIVGVGTYQGVSTWYQMTPQTHQNHPPVAAAGPDQQVGATGTSAPVTLDGSASSDPDSDPLQYLWLEGANSLGTTATLSVSLALGAHTITLRVTDPDSASAEDTVVINVVDVGPPTVQCPGPRTASADANGQASVPDLLSDLVASDNATPAGLLIKTQTPEAGTLVACGPHSIHISVTDAANNTTPCDVAFTVVDTTAPVVQCPGPVTLSPQAECQAVLPNFAAQLGATDNCTPADQLTYSQTPAPGTVISGSQEVDVTVSDQAGNTAGCTIIVQVQDVTPPTITSLSADPDTLRPPNHQMVHVTVSVSATDNCDPHPTCRIVQVCSSEPVMSMGDNTAPDWEITGDLTVDLRAEVAGKDAPRIYTIHVLCTDAAGNQTRQTVTVTVPKNRNG